VSGDRSTGTRDVLESWKKIADYLGRDVRTCRRWEEHLGLPVHRLDGSPKARVLAYKDEIDWWLDAKLHEHDVAAGSSPPVLTSEREAGRFLGLRLPASFTAARRWYALFGFTVFMAVGVLGWRAINNGRPSYVPNGKNPAIVVLPFVNATGDGGLDYLRESVPDDLIRDLQQSSDRLKVYSFQAAMDVLHKLGLDHGAPLKPEEIVAVADRLGAGWFVAGSFDRSGSKIRVRYELHEAGAPAPLKADRVQGTEGEIRAVGRDVADGVRRVFGIPTSAGPESLALCSVQAMRFYEAARALGRKYWVDPKPPVLEQIIGLFTRAREVDPGCPLAYLGLGDAYQYRFVYEADSPETRQLMEENYRKAYQLAPDRAETNVGLSWVHFFRQENDEAYACLKKALAIDPSSLHVLTDVGGFLRSIGLFERAAEFFTRVIQAGGTTADMYMLRGNTYEQMGLFESALGDYDKIISLDPADGRARCHLARALILLKRYDAAEAELTVAAAMAPDAPFVGLVKGLAAAAAGDGKGALAALDLSRDAARPARGTYYRSRIYAALGMADEALAEIESGIDRGFEDIYDYLYVFPFLNNTRDHYYDKLRNDPRFAEILRLAERKHAENLEKYGGL
jgi:tetratricopeptide (TPR) repeat protein